MSRSGSLSTSDVSFDVLTSLVLGDVANAGRMINDFFEKQQN